MWTCRPPSLAGAASAALAVVTGGGVPPPAQDAGAPAVGPVVVDGDAGSHSGEALVLVGGARPADLPTAAAP